MRIHDLRCTAECGYEAERVLIHDKYPPCPECGAPTTWMPAGFNTDVHTMYIEALDGTFTSTREAEKYAASIGFVPSGDKKGGARNEDHMGLGKVFSYSGQKKRTSLERRR